MALGGTAIQSSTNAIHGAAEQAIDGNDDPDFYQRSCSHTQQLPRQWWRLELPGVYRVLEIEVTNRNALRHFINGVEILIGNSMANNGNDNPR